MKKIEIFFASVSLVLMQSPLAHGQDILDKVKEVHNLDQKELQRLTTIFAKSKIMGQGNPKVTQHPVSREQCLDQAKRENIIYENKQFEEICGDRYMAPLYNPSKEKPNDAATCIDQFEFPNIPCEFPVTWVRAKEAHEICQALGKRLCDAHEWEGGCAGSLQPPDYDFAAVKGMNEPAAFRKLRSLHNRKREIKWAYGPKQDHKLCATGSSKSKGCDAALAKGHSVWQACGTNTYPAGYFPKCQSSLGIYDQHGNAAEHMNLPVTSEQMTRNGGTGHTEMKGSWFIFGKISAHKDDCRWRAPYWHGTTVMHGHSHHNYHLGFRCCKSLEPKKKS